MARVTLSDFVGSAEIVKREPAVTDAQWFSYFFEKAFVSRVNLRLLIRALRLLRLRAGGTNARLFQMGPIL
jgi:hypothetical protein